MTQAHILYSGRVQGVGFRYTVRMFASRLGLVGWVKNLTDSRVEVIVEGNKKDIEQLIESVSGQFEGFIREKNINYNPATGQYAEFNVKF